MHFNRVHHRWRCKGNDKDQVTISQSCDCQDIEMLCNNDILMIIWCFTHLDYNNSSPGHKNRLGSLQTNNNKVFKILEARTVIVEALSSAGAIVNCNWPWNNRGFDIIKWSTPYTVYFEIDRVHKKRTVCVKNIAMLQCPV